MTDHSTDSIRIQPVTLSDDTVINNIDEAIRFVDEAENKINAGYLDFEEEYDVRQCITEAQDYLASTLPGEAIKMIEVAHGQISANYSLRTSFSKILQWMANYCPESISLLPDYE